MSECLTKPSKTGRKRRGLGRSWRRAFYGGVTLRESHGARNRVRVIGLEDVPGIRRKKGLQRIQGMVGFNMGQFSALVYAGFCIFYVFLS